MAAGDLDREVDLLEEDRRDVLTGMLNRLQRESLHVQSLESLRDVLLNHVQRMEDYNNSMIKLLYPLVALLTFALPLAIYVCYWLILPYGNEEGLRVLHFWTCLFIVFLTIFYCIPMYMVSVWALRHTFSRANSCRCLHRCHQHFGYTDESEEDGPRLNCRRSTVNHFMERIKEGVTTVLIMISNLIGVPMYICTLCEQDNTTRACHCFYGTLFGSERLESGYSDIGTDETTPLLSERLSDNIDLEIEGLNSTEAEDQNWNSIVDIENRDLDFTDVEDSSTPSLSSSDDRPRLNEDSTWEDYISSG